MDEPGLSGDKTSPRSSGIPDFVSALEEEEEEELEMGVGSGGCCGGCSADLVSPFADRTGPSSVVPLTDFLLVQILDPLDRFDSRLCASCRAASS